MNHDPFLPMGTLAQAADQVTIGTAIAVAFARSPATLAYIGQDLQELTQGPFVLGLGSQVRAHITRRFAMPWSHPAARMREMIQAIHAFWDALEAGTRINFQGDFYSHTLLTPEFSPGPSQDPRAPIYLGAFGKRMTEVAGECADGIFVHSCTTESYLRDITLPALEESIAKAGRKKGDVTVAGLPFLVTGSSEEEFAASKEAIRKRVAWYGSTPAYHPVLELHGWSDLGAELHKLSRSGEPDFVDQMSGLVDDEVLGTFAVIAEPGQLASAVESRFHGCFDRIRLNYLRITDDQLRTLIADLQSGQA